MANAKPYNLWRITSGQRLRYAMAILAMAIMNMLMFGAPLIGKYAIDLVVEGDFGYAQPQLHAMAEQLSGSEPYVAYLTLSAVVAVLLTAIGGVFLYFRGRLAALASEGITRRLREDLYRRMMHLPARFYDSADTGDLVQRSSSDVETLRVFLSSDVVEIGRAIMLVLCVLPFLYYLNVTLAWLSVCLMPFLVVGDSLGRWLPRRDVVGA